MRKSSLLFPLLLICLFSCKQEPNPFPYAKGLYTYAKKELNYDLEKINEQTIVFLPLESCPSCVAASLEFISGFEKQEQTTMILIGKENSNPDNLPTIQKIKQLYPHQLEEGNKHFSYVCGIDKPLIIQIENGQIVDHAYFKTTVPKKVNSLFLK